MIERIGNLSGLAFNQAAARRTIDQANLATARQAVEYPQSNNDSSNFRVMISSFIQGKLPTNAIFKLGVFALESIPQLPFVMRQGILKKAASKGISPESLTDLPDRLNNPIAIFKSRVNPDTNRVILTELKSSDGKPIVAAIEIEESTQQFGKANTILSIHPKDNPSHIIDWAINKNLLVAWNKEKGRNFLQDSAPSNWEQYAGKIDLQQKPSPTKKNVNPEDLSTARQVLGGSDAGDTPSITQKLIEWFKNPVVPLELPPIPRSIAKLLGKEEKPVILKPNILKKNLKTHADLTLEVSSEIIDAALRKPTAIIKDQPKAKPNYFVFISEISPEKSVVLDTTPTKAGHEIVSWRFTNKNDIERLKRKAETEGGQVLIPEENSPAAAGLSADRLDTENLAQNNPTVNPEDLSTARQVLGGSDAGDTPSITQKLIEWFKNPVVPLELPPIPRSIAKLLGKEEKPVILKPNIQNKNTTRHADLSEADSIEIIQSAIQNPSKLIQDKPADRPDYWIFVHEVPNKNRIAIIDVADTKSAYEIVGWRFSDTKDLARIERRAQREGGLVLISDDSTSVAVGLSDVPLSPAKNITHSTPTVNPEDLAAAKRQITDSDYWVLFFPTLGWVEILK